MIVGQGLTLVVIGLGLGLTAALFLARVGPGLLYGVQPIDPMTYGGVAVMLRAARRHRRP